MAQIKKLTPQEFSDIASSHPYSTILFAKDYYVTALLFLLKDVQGIYFKGGTALNKIFLSHARLSEDIDYTLTRPVKEVKAQIISLIKKSALFGSITQDKDVDGFIRIVVEYDGFSGEKGVVFIDLNERAKLLQKPEIHRVNHFYGGNIPAFSVNTLAKNELIAEKMAAAIGRNKPRDHFDLYMILKAGISIDTSLVAKKCAQSGDEFSIISMFKNAKKLKKRWDEDLSPLLAEEIPYGQVMKTLAKEFRLKEEKQNLKKI